MDERSLRPDGPPPSTDPPELIAARRKQSEARGLRDQAGGRDYQKLRAATDLLTDSARALALPEFPVEFATVYADLADVLLQRAQLGDPDVLYEAIDAYFKALIVFNRDEFPEMYAKCYHGLGLAQWTAGNLDAARIGFESVLDVITLEVSPLEHAQARANVAAVLAAMPQPAARREALNTYRAIMELVPADQHPRERAELLLALGQALNVQLEGDRRANLEAAIEAFGSARELAERSGATGLIAESLAQRAVTLADRSRLSGEGSEQAFQALATSLEAFDAVEHPDRHAQIQLKLAQFALDAPGADGRDVTELAVRALEAVLAIKHRLSDSVTLGQVLLLLGDAYLRLPADDPAGYPQRALALATEAQAAWPVAQFPSEHAQVQLNLGRAYAAGSDGDRADGASRALKAFEAGLDAVSRDDAPDVYAALHLNLGKLLLARSDGDRAENLRRAAAAFERVIDIRPADAYPREFGAARHSLGEIALQQPAREPDESFRAAAGHFRAASQARTAAVDPMGFAETQLMLGIALASLAGGREPALLREAAEACRQALTVYTRVGHPREFASTHNNLAAVLDILGGTDGAQDLRAAIASYELAASVFTSADYPRQHDMIQANLRRVRARLEALP